MLPWSKNNDDTLPFLQTAPFAPAAKTPPYTGCLVQTVSHTAYHHPELPSHPPIHQYITKKRLALCREAILGQMSITEAYQTFGFGDYSSFYRAFKKEYGISPKDFRDMQKDLLV